MLISAANLKDADLSEADLMGAWLIGANLESAQLFGAHLEKAFLVAAHLKGAIVYLAYLDQARLDGADVGGADFDLIPDSLPEVFGLYTTQNLDLVKFSYQPAGLVKLRSKCKELGLRTAENQLTCAIRRSELSREDSYTRLQVHSRFERGINYVLFDLTCQYGLSPSRPLIIVGLLAVLFAVVYVLAQSSPGRHGGIWVVWDEHLVDRKEGSGVPQRLTNGFPTTQYRGRMRRFFSVVGLAAYFSLLSALRIGWHELNVGTWITRLQPREYLLRASGWVRIVSGLQSLISVYMVALAILTYFGTPF